VESALNRLANFGFSRTGFLDLRAGKPREQRGRATHFVRQANQQVRFETPGTGLQKPQRCADATCVRYSPSSRRCVGRRVFQLGANRGSSCHTKYSNFGSVSNAKAPTAPIIRTKAQSPIELQIGLFTRTISDIGAIRVSATTGSLSASSKLAHGSTNCSIASPAEVIISTH